MNRWHSRTSILLGLCSVAILMGNDGCETEEAESVPAADAGIDLVIALGDAAALDGSASSDPLGEGLTYYWNLESKPVSSDVTTESFTQNESVDAVNSSFVPDQPGTYGVSLYVENTTGNMSDLDYVVVIAGSTNTLPIADAGEDVNVAVDQVANLDGTASNDPEGADLSYEWSFDLVPAESALSEDTDLFNQGSPEAAIVPDVAGQYVLRLRVYDGEFWSAPDFVTVSAVDDNALPIANAGGSWELTPCSADLVEFDGRASYDPEGSDITYLWELVSVPDGSAITQADVAGLETGTPSLTWDVVGLYTLRLVVNDGLLNSEPDYVAVRTVPHLPNDVPTADAGGNITINASAYCSGSCSPCGSREELLDGSWSTDPDNDPLDYTWTVINGSATINGEHAEQAELVLPSLNTTPNNYATATVQVQLDVEDCQGEDGRDSDVVSVTFRCYGQTY
jgi:hypothetical protein